MPGIIASILSLFSTVAGGIFSGKEKKADVLIGAMETVKDINSSESARDAARAQILSNDSRSESWITRSWRPITALIFVIDLHIMLYWLISGNFPDVLYSQLPPIIDRLIDVVIFCLGGYMGLRTFEKIAHDINLGAVIKKYIDKIT